MTAMPRLSLIPLLLALPACQPDPGDDTTSADEPSTSTTLVSGATDMSESTGTTGQASEPTTGGETTADPTTGDPTGDPTTGGPAIVLDAPCSLDVADPSRLALITNNFIDPASLHVIDLADESVLADVAPAPSDPALAWGGGNLLVLGRFGINTLEVLAGDDMASLAKIDVKADDTADANPQAVAFGPDGRAYLTLFASAQVQVHDLAAAPEPTLVDTIDLSTFADRDGSPEAGAAFTCGDVLFVAIQRLVNFAPVDLGYLVPIDLASGAPIDLDPATAGPQALPLLGGWAKQIRSDPADASGHTVLALTAGIERIDLSLGTSTWALDPAVLAAVGVEAFDPQGFAVAADGASVYLLATDGDYPAAAVFHVGLDGRAPAEPALVVSGVTSRERTIERIGGALWVGDASPVATRMRRFDLAQRPPVELAAIDTPGEPFLTLAIP
jgi:hypothetical protein